ERTPEVSGASAGSAAEVPGDASARGLRIAGMGLRALGLISALRMVLVFAGSTEDAGSSWGALFMQETFAAAPFLAGGAVLVPHGARAVVRVTGDADAERLLGGATARLCAAVGMSAISLALPLPSPATPLLGFAPPGSGVGT